MCNVAQLTPELRSFFTTPVRLRSKNNLCKAASYLRANGITRAVLGVAYSDEALAQHLMYER